MSLLSDAKASIAKLLINMGRFDVIMNGDKTTDVSIDNGTVPTIRKLFDYIVNNVVGVVIKGTVNNVSDLPSSGNKIGDIYIVLNAGAGNVANDGYVWLGSSWRNIGQIRGPKGDKGDKGDAGTGGGTNTGPGYVYASSFGAATDAADNSVCVANAIASLPNTGGIVYLPTGDLPWKTKLTVDKRGVRIVGTARHGTTILVSNSSLSASDVIVLNGEACSVENLSFYTDNAIPKTGGYNIVMNGPMTSVRDVTINQPYIGILMAPDHTAAWVEKVKMEYLATSAGSGGIVVNNRIIGPANTINNVQISADGTSGAYPTFGIQLYNTGFTYLDKVETLSMNNSLLINPSTRPDGSEGKVEATYLTDCCFDSCKGHSILIQPAGLAHVFALFSKDTWITNTVVLNTHGIYIDGTNLNGGYQNGTGIRDISIQGGWIISTTGNLNSDSPTGTGLNIVGSSVAGVTAAGVTIAGFGTGVYIGAGASSIAVTGGCKIGRYSPYATVTTNSASNLTGVNIAVDAGEYINVMGNLIVGNIANVIYSMPANRSNWRVQANTGYNPVGGQSVTKGGSPWTYKNGAEPCDFLYDISGVQNITLANGNVAIPVNGQFHIEPGQTVVINYTGNPNFARNVH